MYNEQFKTDRMNRGCGRGGHRFGGRFGHGHGRNFEGRFGEAFRRVPVNIEENDDHFIIHLYAPALIKENLKVVTKNDVLTISYKPAEENKETNTFSRREYANGAFERGFALNAKVLTENISVTYADGILKVTLPKNPETNTPAKDILVD
ncbi:Hsp20/alpha crystallin family protein [Pedobacter punctiformis]|uniref:Hsp20/alpha crystallin family protein n=1 Tax=Pedobacter punctiformis TaxID=3004097 RepID=A0ABT4L589_9SPHI|nr:Hsp20/alpha crystallin family protein [Pedobacter sp. HCMS5-2]MCZ4243082.1 Hsp20/alpha crystallin family protein [Pedobacter sp. HCMS5-2]